MENLLLRRAESFVEGLLHLVLGTQRSDVCHARRSLQRLLATGRAVVQTDRQTAAPRLTLLQLLEPLDRLTCHDRHTLLATPIAQQQITGTDQGRTAAHLIVPAVERIDSDSIILVYLDG